MLLELLMLLVLGQSIPCTIKDGPASTVDGLRTQMLTCRQNRKTFKKYIPRSLYRFNCKMVFLERREGVLTWAAQPEGCHVIDTQNEIKACKAFWSAQQSAKGYDAAREGWHQPNCTYYWLNATGDKLLVPPHLVVHLN